MTIVRIDQPAFALFNGKLGGVKFNNGVSERPLTLKEIRKVGINVRIVDAETGEHVTVHNHIGKVEARQLIDVPTADKEIPIATGTINATSIPVGSIDVLKIEDELIDKPETVKYTKEDLEAIADKTGIKGIREIATAYDIKGVQISQLIDGILAAQG